MSINHLGRGRSVGMGQQELEARLPQRSASSSETSIVFQRGTPDLTRLRRQAMSTPPKIQAAQQGLAGHIGAAMSPNTKSMATGAIKHPTLSSSSRLSQAKARINEPIKQPPLQSISPYDAQKESIKAVQALMKKFPDKMPSAKSFWDARLTKPDEYKLFESFAKVAGFGDDLEFLKAVIDFRNNPTAELAQNIVDIFIEAAPINDEGVTTQDGKRMQLNMDSDQARKKLILAVKTCIEGLSSDQDHVREQAQLALPKVFDSVERVTIASVFPRNLNGLLDHAVSTEKIQQKKALKSFPVSPLSFA